MKNEVSVNERTRLPLSLERVLGAAIATADQLGLDSLTMRGLARDLGVEPMSLYYYVANKDQLLNAMLDRVMSEIELPPDSVAWRPALRSLALSAHAVLEAHQWAAGYVMSAARLGPNRMRFMDAMLGRLREAGFPPGTIDLAYHALDSHIVGASLWALSVSPGLNGQPGGADPRELARDFLRSLPDGLPNLADHVEYHLSTTAVDSSFEFGLDLLLEGIEKLRQG